MKPALLLIALAIGGALQLHAQSSTDEIELRAAAIKQFLKPGSNKVVLVPSDDDDHHDGRISTLVGGVRPSARSCTSIIGCEWLPGKDTMAVRATVKSISESQATVVLDSWKAVEPTKHGPDRSGGTQTMH